MFGKDAIYGLRATGLLSGVLAAGVASSVASSVASHKNAKAGAERDMAIARARLKLWMTYPGELGGLLEAQFRASQYVDSPDIDGTAQAYTERAIYKFFFYRVDEEFADALIARMRKLIQFGIDLSLSDLLARTLAQLKFEQGPADAFAAEAQEYMDGLPKAYYDSVSVNVRPNIAVGKKMAAKHYDAIASQVVVQLGDRGVIMRLPHDYRCARIVGHSVTIFPTYDDYYEGSRANLTPVAVDEDTKVFFITNYLPKIVSTLYQRAD